MHPISKNIINVTLNGSSIQCHSNCSYIELPADVDHNIGVISIV